MCVAGNIYYFAFNYYDNVIMCSHWEIFIPLDTSKSEITHILLFHVSHLSYSLRSYEEVDLGMVNG